MLDLLDDAVVPEGATDKVSHCWGSLGDMVAQTRLDPAGPRTYVEEQHASQQLGDSVVTLSRWSS
jgi:hypothetical protein